MRKTALIFLMAASLGLGACSGLNATQERILTGGAIGRAATPNRSP